MKQTLSLLVVFLLSVMLPADLFGVQIVTIGDLTYQLNETELTAKVTSSYDAAGYVNIPSKVTYEDVEYTVTAIASYAFYKNIPPTQSAGVTEVVIPETVEEIGNCAFKGCEELTTLYILSPNLKISPNASYTSKAFINCSSLNQVYTVEGYTFTEMDFFNGSMDLPTIITGTFAFDEEGKILMVKELAEFKDEDIVGNTTPYFAKVATYTRQDVKAGQWNTLCLPYDCDIPEGVTVEEFAEFTSKSAARFTKVDRISAGQPYIFMSNADGDVEFRAENAKIYSVEEMLPGTNANTGKALIGITYMVYTSNWLISVVYDRYLIAPGSGTFQKINESRDDYRVLPFYAFMQTRRSDKYDGVISIVPEMSITASIGGLNYQLDPIEHTATLVDAHDAEGYMVIPSSVTYEDEEYTVTAIADGAFCLEDEEQQYTGAAVTTVVIPATVKTIGSRAFYGCEELTDVYLLSPDAAIGDEAFAGCTALVAVSTVEGHSYQAENFATSEETAPQILVGEYIFDEEGVITRVVALAEFNEETPFNNPTAYLAKRAEYTRKTVMVGQWYTIYLPFGCDVPQGVTVEELETLDIDENNDAKFTKVERIEAGKTYLITSDTERDVTFAAENVVIKPVSEIETQAAGKGFVGVLSKTYTEEELTELGAAYTIDSNDRVFRLVSEDGAEKQCLPFHAFLLTGQEGQNIWKQIYIMCEGDTAMVSIGGLNYILDLYNTTATVADNHKAKGYVVIPSSVAYNEKEYTVTAIADGAFCLDGEEQQQYTGAAVTTVVIPETVKTIGSRAFYGCEELTDVYLLSPDATIGNEAFAGCAALVAVSTVEGHSYQAENFATSAETSPQILVGEYIFDENGVITRVVALAEFNDGTAFDNPTAYLAKRAEYTRKTVMVGQWYTIYLPFGCDVPQGVTVEELETLDIDENNDAKFTKVERIEAGKTYLITSDTERDVTFAAENVVIKPASEIETQAAGKGFVGVLSKTYTEEELTELGAAYTIDSNDRVFRLVSEDGAEKQCLPFHAFLLTGQEGQNIWKQIYIMCEGDTAMVSIGGLNYILDLYNTTATVADNHNAKGYVVIPSSVAYNEKEYTVTAIADGAFCLDGEEQQQYTGAAVTTVVIPETVKTIGSRAFYGCEELTDVYLLSPDAAIGDEAFAGCTALVAVSTVGEHDYQAENFATSEETAPQILVGEYIFDEEGMITRVVELAEFNDGTAFDNPTAYLAKRAEYTRKAVTAGQWSTVCLPFGCDVPQGVTVEKFEKFTGNDAARFAEVSQMEAGQAYLFKSETDGDVTFAVDNAIINKVDDIVMHDEDIAFAGTLTDEEPSSATCYIYFFNPESGTFQLQTASDGAVPGAFRAYLQVNKEGGYASVIYVEHEHDIMTGINRADTDVDNRQPSTLYNLNGQRIATPRKGIYIIDGKKRIIR